MKNFRKFQGSTHTHTYVVICFFFLVTCGLIRKEMKCVIGSQWSTDDVWLNTLWLHTNLMQFPSSPDTMCSIVLYDLSILLRTQAQTRRIQQSTHNHKTHEPAHARAIFYEMSWIYFVCFVSNKMRANEITSRARALAGGLNKVGLKKNTNKTLDSTEFDCHADSCGPQSLNAHIRTNE